MNANSKIVRDENSKKSSPPRTTLVSRNDYLVPCDAWADVIAFHAEENVDPEDIYHGEEGIHLPHAVIKLEEATRNGYSRRLPVCKTNYSFLVDNLSEQEFFSKAVGGCHSSCVECLEEFGINMFGPLDAELQTNE